MTQTLETPIGALLPAGHGVYLPSRSPLRRAEEGRSDSSSPARRGRLKNGNRSGDFLAAPRCGAHTRSGGSCRQPAMANGRCRLHGGLSTGPRTPAGLACSRRARWKHGARSAEVRALRRAARAQLRRIRTLLSGARLSAGHGVHRSKASATLAKVNRRDAEAPRYRASGSNRACSASLSSLREQSSRHQSSPDGVAHPNIPDSASPRLCVSAVHHPSSAGHGVHRSNPQSRPASPILPTRRDRLRSSASIGGLTYARPLGMGSIA